VTAPPLPRFAARLVARLAPARDADIVVADLAQDYGRAIARDGAARARW
jgi:hypothetical protein